MSTTRHGRPHYPRRRSCHSYRRIRRGNSCLQTSSNSSNSVTTASNWSAWPCGGSLRHEDRWDLNTRKTTNIRQSTEIPRLGGEDEGLLPARGLDKISLGGQQAILIDVDLNQMNKHWLDPTMPIFKQEGEDEIKCHDNTGRSSYDSAGEDTFSSTL